MGQTGRVDAVYICINLKRIYSIQQGGVGPEHVARVRERVLDGGGQTNTARCGLFTLVVMLHLCLSALARIFTGIWLSARQISGVWYNRQSHSEREDDCSGGRVASGCAGIRVGHSIVGGPRNDHVSIVGPCWGQVHGENGRENMP